MIGRAVTVIRKGVAHVIAFVAWCFDRLARFFAGVARRVYPTTPRVAIGAAVRAKDATPTRYTVLRWQNRRHWTLYSGMDGGHARRAYEAVEKAKEPGRMEFQMTIPGGYVVRGVYENGEW